MAWTDERVEKLKQLWEEGKSASEIAKELGNVTRNAVIGKVHRMGLQARNTGSAAKVETKVKPATKKPVAKNPAKPNIEDSEVIVEEAMIEVTAEIEVEVEVVETKALSNENQFPAIIPGNNDEISEETRRNVERVENESKRLSLMQLTERTCKWPIGDPATEDFWFCGHPSEAGKPYCQAHVELAFQAPMSRRDRKSS